MGLYHGCFGRILYLIKKYLSSGYILYYMSKIYKCKTCSNRGDTFFVKINNENFDLNRCPKCASLIYDDDFLETDENPDWLYEEANNLHTKTCFKCTSSYNGKLVFVFGVQGESDILKYVEDTRCPRCGVLSSSPDIGEGNADFEEWKEERQP